MFDLKSMVLAAGLVAFAVFPASAAPTMMKGDATQAVNVDELCSRMGSIDAKDLDDFLAAKSVTVFHIPDSYSATNTDANKKMSDNEKACDAMAAASGPIGTLREQLAGNADVVKWFTDNGFNVNDAVALVHHTDSQTFDLYMR